MTRLYERQKAVSEIWALGRVQTPTLTLPYMREMEILTFKPASYWELHGTFALAAGTYVGKWRKPKVAVDTDGTAPTDRKSVLSGQRESVRVNLGGRGNIK